MSFKKNKYKIVKNAIPIDVANFVHDYFVIKRNVFATLKNSTYISKFNEDWGKTGDEQCPQSYSHYADLAMETILELLTVAIPALSYPLYSRRSKPSINRSTTCFFETMPIIPHKSSLHPISTLVINHRYGISLAKCLDREKYSQ